MNAARRRQQGYRVNKREIQDPLSSFAQNGIKTQGDPPNPLDMLQEDVSPFVRGMKDVSEFNTQYNDMMYALAEYQNMLKRGEEMTPKSTVQVGMRPIKDTPQSNYITASDIAALQARGPQAQPHAMSVPAPYAQPQARLPRHRLRSWASVGVVLVLLRLCSAPSWLQQPKPLDGARLLRHGQAQPHAAPPRKLRRE